MEKIKKYNGLDWTLDKPPDNMEKTNKNKIKGCTKIRFFHTTPKEFLTAQKTFTLFPPVMFVSVNVKYF